MAKRPKIPLPMTDRVSAKDLAMHGNTICQMPNVDALADSGLVFTIAFCNSPPPAPDDFAS